MRIISINAWGGAMFEALAAWLPECGADVLCVQEVTHTPGLQGWTHFADGERTLPQRASLLSDLKVALPDHQALFVASDAGPVTGSHGLSHRQEFGIAMLVSPRCRVTHRESRFVHGAYQHHSQWPASGRPRVAFSARVGDPSSDRTVAITHLHGLRDAAGKGDTPARRLQAERLASLIQRVGDGADLSVACGDFNLLPDSETFSILAEAGMTDLVGEADTRTSRYEKPLRHANYLLVSDVGAVKRFEIPQSPEVSDHRMLVVEV